jgi:hypothetical protein
LMPDDLAANYVGPAHTFALELILGDGRISPE